MLVHITMYIWWIIHVQQPDNNSNHAILEVRPEYLPCHTVPYNQLLTSMYT